MKRREILKGGAMLALVPVVGACGRTPEQQTGYFEEGVYLSNNFGPVDVESTITDLNVVGTCPITKD